MVKFSSYFGNVVLTSKALCCKKDKIKARQSKFYLVLESFGFCHQNVILLDILYHVLQNTAADKVSEGR